MEVCGKNCKDIPAVNSKGDVVGFNGANASNSFNFKAKITLKSKDNGIKEVEIMVPLKHWSNFWKTPEILLIDCQINLILTWSANCVIVYTNVASRGATFSITKTKLYVKVLTLSTQDNANLLQHLKWGFKRIIKTRIICTKSKFESFSWTRLSKNK